MTTIGKILITTSGIGSRLGNLTEHTNKCLVRISNKPAISHIVEKYPPDLEFVITLGHHGELVRQFLTLTYPEHNFTFVEVDKYEGDGSSLGYSILQAKEALQGPFIFNACDTLMRDDSGIEKLLNAKRNFCVGDTRTDSSQYATLLVNDGKVEVIKSKGEINYDYVYIGISGIFDYKQFFDTLGQMCESNLSNESLYEGDVINKMIKQMPFDFIEVDNWLDIGNVGELERTRSLFKPEADVLEKREESIYFFNDSIIKFFNDENVVSSRVERAKKLYGLVPNIISSTKNFYKYEKVSGELMSEIVDDNLLLEFLHWANQNLWKEAKSKSFQETCSKFYIDKTRHRINKYLLFNSDISCVNGKNLPSIWALLEKINIDWLCDGTPVSFHGDFILDNVLKTNEGFCLLDWRQDFGGDLDVGDLYYDLSKLNHNLTINHDIVNRGLYSDDPNSCYILCSTKLLSCQSTLHNYIINNNLDLKKVKVLTALIWLNMSPLHEYPFNKFLFNFGKLKLSEALNA